MASQHKYINIFDTVTDNAREATELKIRSDLMLITRKIIHERGLTQQEAATFFHFTQPRISELMTGKIDKFSIDQLISCLVCIGYQIKPRYINHSLAIQVENANQPELVPID